MSWFSDAWNWLGSNVFHPGYRTLADAAKAFWMPQAYATEQNAKQQVATNVYNRENVMMQNQWNLEQWQRENAYNNPVNQMQRMRAAGLNPALMYGGSGSIATSAPSPMMQGARDVAPQLAGMDNMLNSMLTLAQVRNIDASTEKTKEETREKEISNEVGGMNAQAFKSAFDRGLVGDACRAGFQEIVDNARINRYTLFESAWNFAILAGCSLEESFTSANVHHHKVLDSDGLEFLDFVYDDKVFKKANNLYIGGQDAQMAANEAARIAANVSSEKKQKDFDIYKYLNDLAKSKDRWEHIAGSVALLGLFIAEQRFASPSISLGIKFGRETKIKRTEKD